MLTDAAPLVIVGLPRSGSTLLTRIINDSPDFYVLNDLYALQSVDSMDAWDGFKSEADARAFIRHLEAKVVRRSAVRTSATIANSARMTEAQLDETLLHLRAGPISLEHWAGTLNDVMSYILDVVGKSRWGYNTPQDFRHVDRIMGTFPEAQIIFLLRDPRNTLLSYKHYPRASARGRYHPAVQSSVWGAAVRSYQVAKRRYGSQILLVKYEDLVRSTAATVAVLNDFLRASIAVPNLAEIRANTSFKSGSRPTLSEFELWLSDRFVYKARAALEYDYPRQRFSTKGLTDTLGVSLRFIRYYSSLLLSSRDARKRVRRFVSVSQNDP